MEKSQSKIKNNLLEKLNNSKKNSSASLIMSETVKSVDDEINSNTVRIASLEVALKDFLQRQEHKSSSENKV